MSALVSCWHRAATNYRRDALDAIALLAARTAERDELRDELTVCRAAHDELARSLDRIREQLRAVQSELAQRASIGLDAGRAVRDEADAKWKLARDRLRAAEREVELARWDEDAARQDADEAHRAVASHAGEVAA
jgi:tetrahydromethanopterin S-methyltransferase subunit G